MDDEEDVKKMMQLIKSSQNDNSQDFLYDDFINCESSDIEANEDVICFDENYEFCNFTNTDISKLNSYDPRSTLVPDERAVIDSCSDPELKSLLLLNRTKNFQLMQLYKKLKDLLIQCQKDIIDKTEVITRFLKASTDQAQSSGAWRLGAPYFKDKKLFGCSGNADALRKRRNKELCAYDIISTTKWSSIECDKLLGAVKVNYNINRQNEVMKKILNLRQNKDAKNKEELEKLEHIMEDLQREDNYDLPPLNSDEYIDWIRVSEVFLQDRRTASECKSFWHIYLHPHISKSPWSAKENIILKQLVVKHKYQKWDEIAKEFDTTRTGFTACMNYYRNLHEKFKKGEFSYEEDALLVHLVDKHRMGNYIPWAKIVQHFKNRTRSQIHHRYVYFLSENDKRKGKFTLAEDALLMILVDKFGRNFRKCSKYFPTRALIQIKARFNTNLTQKLKKGSFTLEEDEMIMKFVDENGDRCWSKLAKLIKRSRGQVRQRYNTIIYHLSKSPDATLANVPRRKHFMEEEENCFSFVRMVADRYIGSQDIPTLKEIETVIKKMQNENPDDPKKANTISTPNVSNNYYNIDDKLTDFFCNSFKTKKHSNCIPPKYVTRAVADVQTVLDMLDAKLDIPENFDEDMRLDNLDVAILNSITENNIQKNRCDNIEKLLPPNLNNTIGIRNLLLNYYSEKWKYSEDKFIDYAIKKKFLANQVKAEISTNLLKLPHENRIQVENDLKLFCRRFQCLFKWPAIMTLESPTPGLLDVNSDTISSRKLDVKRTYSRASRDKTSDCPEKRIKVSELPCASTKAVPLKLTPVTNKSVIEDLIRNRNKKLFSMETVKIGSETKVVIKEVDFRPAVANKLLNGTTTIVNNSNSGKFEIVDHDASTSVSRVKCYGLNSRKTKSFNLQSGNGDVKVQSSSTADYNNIAVVEDEQNMDVHKRVSAISSVKSYRISNESVVKSSGIKFENTNVLEKYSNNIINIHDSTADNAQNFSRLEKFNKPHTFQRATTTTTKCWEPSSPIIKSDIKLEMENVNIRLEAQDDHSTIAEPGMENGADDEEDLKRLENFLREQNVDTINGEDDLEDLKKLENFLKIQDEDRPDYI